ncbi:MAG: immunity 49 family protein [Deltaproteobacteria bacterium]|nr:immunity 49 family protein [Deltaproteobacteria bacterium]
MSSYFLSVFSNNATLELEEMLPAVLSSSVDLDSILQFCQHYRIRGICSLFLSDSAAEFLADLRKSGRAFLHFLANSRASDKSTSKAEPFFDSIASRDLVCAREIARNSRLTWNKNEEYEDDFQYILFLMNLFFLYATEEACERNLQRYEEILDGDADPRLDICRAFAVKDSEEFHVALGELLEAHESRYQRLSRVDAILPEEAATEGKLCVEGLALLNLAEMMGLALDEDYLFIPSTARDQVAVVFSDDDWKNPS